MATGIWAAASGAVAQTSALDISANNVANARTAGFRADVSVFRQTLVEAMDQSNGTQSQRYAVSRTVEPNFTMGEIVSTGNKLDVALTDERSFFAVQTPQGIRYTRAGAVRVAPDGTLTTPEGYAYLGENKRPLAVPPAVKAATFTSDGRLQINTEPFGGIETTSKLLTVSFERPEALVKEGNVLFRASEGSGMPVATDVQLALESLELSNANPVKAMTGLVSASRQFEMVSRVIEAFSSIEKRTATDVMKKT